ncbi:hypothetical protein EV198_2091 [Roseivirga ehrenbergii]|uniref:Uncharacterized protein n=1 Tax=Roseivirga ehrenbergii (strain DSM 102268 / JCM 13514 / KCTC 12282 / NCIMB 14502 / KMM 6017) TaxID=279360 RepID=A0A150WYU4_ROSEK|nr:hypothetical protein [Roseivirga ehrenbergii]KYG71653.1 hypothetical protein MB14_10055 [Roseivirga ehrenbergii]TCL07658.1 hypothetical protein EV198_2091 [Roseivirga ehrenbergii]
MKKIYLLLIFLITLSACDEGGILITVPSVGNYEFTINSDEANSSANNSYTAERLVDPSALFTEDSELIKNITLNQLTYEISGYSGTVGNDVLMSLSLSTELNGTTTEVLSVAGITLANGLFTAFESGNASSQLTAAQVASLEAIIDNQEPFNLIVTAGFDKDIESDFTVEVVWDITASISQNTD